MLKSAQPFREKGIRGNDSERFQIPGASARAPSPMRSHTRNEVKLKHGEENERAVVINPEGGCTYTDVSYRTLNRKDRRGGERV